MKLQRVAKLHRPTGNDWGRPNWVRHHLHNLAPNDLSLCRILLLGTGVPWVQHAGQFVAENHRVLRHAETGFNLRHSLLGRGQARHVIAKQCEELAKPTPRFAIGRLPGKDIWRDLRPRFEFDRGKGCEGVLDRKALGGTIRAKHNQATHFGPIVWPPRFIVINGVGNLLMQTADVRCYHLELFGLPNARL